MRRHEQILLLQTLVQSFSFGDLNTFGFDGTANSVRQAQNRAKTKEYQAYTKPKPPGTKKYQSEDFLILFEWIDVNTTETCEAQIVKPKPTFRACTESFRVHLEAQQGFLEEIFNPALAREWRWEKRISRGTKRALYIEFKKDHPESPFTESAFRKATKRLGRAKRRTDVCNRCDRLSYLRKLKAEMIGAESRPQLTVQVAFYHEGHGKPRVDSAFGYLTNKVKDHLGEQVISTIQDFIAFFETLKAKSIISTHHIFEHFTPPPPASLPGLKINGHMFYLVYVSNQNGISAAPLANASLEQYRTISAILVETKRTKPEKSFGQVIHPFTIATHPQSMNITIDREKGEKKTRGYPSYSKNEDEESSSSGHPPLTIDLPQKTK
ncbi:hypothetical protein BLNAU_25089 [Blattamonas nauphoetae]|uniref:Uncharacterized protein n=1 Tax=Blattamonas nauphoetae TaxID=2049346 RepID=A0ABQ9WLD8_9EUKA|nr:hypothetical protein BLNAU_25089 [Blattamonas nauphoetae]